VTDARAYKKRARGTYDLILFGLLDSHTLADYSNMRIHNFVYTKESFPEAKSLLAPGGVVFIKFQVDRPWLGKRLAAGHLCGRLELYGRSYVLRYFVGTSRASAGCGFRLE
jgi:hypothetical protein